MLKKFENIFVREKQNYKHHAVEVNFLEKIFKQFKQNRNIFFIDIIIIKNLLLPKMEDSSYS